ncbi:hypothetical protein [Paraburkholderia aspalathi]|uniref:hypothetical protein n=1 Tax=Paraburkholderia aspalathi TaxID=1324617 RepID=UPI001F211394|nr:hypothetical protein [Paraburkholderia aspalathi]
MVRLVAQCGGFLARKGDGETWRQNDLGRLAARHDCGRSHPCPTQRGRLGVRSV